MSIIIRFTLKTDEGYEHYDVTANLAGIPRAGDEVDIGPNRPSDIRVGLVRWALDGTIAVYTEAIDVQGLEGPAARWRNALGAL